jgi:dTDP-4-dehydrorhamnose 3,5-epimerase
MKFEETNIKGAYVIHPEVYSDERGTFCETWNLAKFSKEVNIPTKFVQMNTSRSKQNVLRGLHYQIHNPQAKLVWVGSGRVLDVFVDLRKNSETFGRWDSRVLLENTLIYIPEGCAHGFHVRSENATFHYLVSDFRYPEFERTLIWNDPDLNIDWNVNYPILSDKDKLGQTFKDCEKY